MLRPAGSIQNLAAVCDPDWLEAAARGDSEFLAGSWIRLDIHLGISRLQRDERQPTPVGREVRMHQTEARLEKQPWRAVAGRRQHVDSVGTARSPCQKCERTRGG